jgi:hypothetical protein
MIIEDVDRYHTMLSVSSVATVATGPTRDHDYHDMALESVTGRASTRMGAYHV